MVDNAAETVIAAVADGVVGPALAYVAADVRRQGGRVRVAHVVPAPSIPGLPEPLVVEGDTLRRAGADLVDRTSSALEHLLPDTVVLPTVLHGPTVPQLVRAARGARSVVVQRRPRGWRRVMTLSTSTGVAAHADAPVVVVPDDWAPDRARDGVVVLGVDDVLTSPLLVASALQEAAARAARLRIVHAWRVSDQYDDLVFAGVAGKAHEEELRRDLERELHPTLMKHPEVAVELVVEHAHPGDLLVAESARAGLVVLGRHHPAGSWGPHLGSVVRAVLRESECPVMVVDAWHSRPARSRAEETAGASEPT